jgi:tetratricopeptide (TPR) repeat protein
MKLLCITLLAIACSLTGIAQTIKHKPYPKSKRIHDEAISLYLNYPTNKDSIKSVIAQLDKAIKLDSDYFSAWSNKLNFECQLKKYKNAVVTAQYMTKIFPWENDVLLSLGVLQYKTKQKEAAKATFTKLLQTYNALPEGGQISNNVKADQLNKGIVLMLTGMDKEGKAYLEK